MVNQEKVRLMTRLAILEKQHGKQIRKAENAFRIDLLTNPVWKMGFFVSLVFAAAAGILAVCNINMFLDAFATGKLKSLIMIVLVAYGSVLLLAVVISAARSYGAYRRSVYYQRQYRSLLEKIRNIEPDRGQNSSRYAPGGRSGGSRYTPEDRSGGSRYDRRYSPDGSHFPPGEDGEDRDEEREKRADKRKREELDYRHMQTLEFEDDEYSYYVEATPKRGGRGG